MTAGSSLPVMAVPPNPYPGPFGGYGDPFGGYPPPPPPPPPPGPVWGYPGVPAGMYVDPATSLILPQGVELASVGRRIGSWFLAIPLFLVTLGIGYVIWSLLAWGRGQTPALQLLNLRCWRPADGRPSGFWWMAMREVVGNIAQNLAFPIVALVSFILFAAGREHRSLRDYIAGDVVVHDPARVLR